MDIGNRYFLGTIDAVPTDYSGDGWYTVADAIENGDWDLVAELAQHGDPDAISALVISDSAGE